jgi:hypothetical protein
MLHRHGGHMRGSSTVPERAAMVLSAIIPRLASGRVQRERLTAGGFLDFDRLR